MNNVSLISSQKSLAVSINGRGSSRYILGQSNRFHPMPKIKTPTKQRTVVDVGTGCGDASDPLCWLLAQQAFFHGLEAQQLEKIAALAMEIRFRPGQVIFQQGDPANRFYLILEGKVELETQTKNAGAISVLALGPGDNLGWSWLFAPHSFRLSARAVEPIRAIFFYGTILRQLCEDDRDLGYELMKRVAGLIAPSFIAFQENLANPAKHGISVPTKHPSLKSKSPA